jgi:hypothetical protein
MSIAPLSTRPEPEVRQALEDYMRSQKVRVSKSAVLEAALRRFLLQEGFLLDDETYSEKDIRDIKAAQKDEYISLKTLKARL